MQGRVANDLGAHIWLEWAGMSIGKGYHETRFEYDPRREVLWRSLYRFYFRRWISEEDCVLELGAGYGHFTNNVQARRRIALDVWSEMPAFLRPGVEGHVGGVTDLSFLREGSVDFVLASNLFEHISQADLSDVPIARQIIR